MVTAKELTVDQLTERELALIKQLCLPSKIIGENLKIPTLTVNVLVSRICARFGVENRAALVVKALKLGLVNIDQLVYRKFNGETNSS